MTGSFSIPRPLAPLSLGLALAACAPPRASHGDAASTAVIAAELEALGGDAAAAHPDTFRAILETALAEDPYVCAPSPREVFFGAAPAGERAIKGSMPHYGLFFGPMAYRVRRLEGAAGWEVRARIALDLPPEGEELELPDCALAGALEGPTVCAGVPYAQSPSTKACPASGRFSAHATRRNVEALLARWSREVATYYERDARRFGLPVRYLFEYVAVPAALPGDEPEIHADLRLPLRSTCGRTPYFEAFRAGWSLPIVAHETGHVLGLLDEYEALSGIVKAYPKKPFPGAEVSRMGLSMREGTLVLPLHHYLVLRRWFCPEPPSGGPFAHVL